MAGTDTSPLTRGVAQRKTRVRLGHWKERRRQLLLQQHSVPPP